MNTQTMSNQATLEAERLKNTSNSFNKQFFEAARVPENGTEMTKYFEGWKPKIYIDTTGNKTIGYGFKISSTKNYLPKDVLAGKRGLTQEEAEPIFNMMYSEAKNRAINYTTPEIFSKLNPLQQNILIDMSYNLGNKLLGFKEMRKALLNNDFSKVTKEMKNSNWYEQVGRRSRYHVDKFNTSIGK